MYELVTRSDIPEESGFVGTAVYLTGDLSFFHLDYSALARGVADLTQQTTGAFPVYIESIDGQSKCIGTLDIVEGKFMSWTLEAWMRSDGVWTTWANETGLHR